ncbi:MAG: methyltransferase domain-containing protein [Bacteroidales bacterium]|nr:methyltransferase domain-containing protein [Bacteroidales bacterium]
MKLESPLKEKYGKDRLSIFEAQRAAQEIAFAPIAFQASRMMLKLGVFQALKDNPDGLTMEEIAGKCNISNYAAKVLVEASLSIGTVIVKDDLFFLTKTGWYLLTDKMTQVNMDFVNDVNYLGFFNLEESLKEGRPAGLKALGDWPTVYEGLKYLGEPAKSSWFAFDHFYSDNSFQEALKIVFSQPVARLLDVGGNTGKFSLKCVEYNDSVNVTVMDLPGQLDMLKENIQGKKGADRISTFPRNVLKDNDYPQGFDVVWMSQFLDCFSEEQIFRIISNAKASLNKGGRLIIMENLWDKQKYETATYCLTMTSLYFTVIANGNSKMYHSEDLIRILENAGYRISAIHTDIGGYGHTILECTVE